MIEKNIPLPENLTESKYQFADMEIGDSILIKENAEKARTTARVYAHRCRAKGINKVFASRAQKQGGVRIWRIE